MISNDTAEYQLLDFGNGKKLERWAARTLIRSSPAAEHFEKQRPEMWDDAELVLDGESPATDGQRDARNDWHIAWEQLKFELRVTPFGHVGLFPEHAPNARWLLHQMSPLVSLESRSSETAVRPHDMSLATISGAEVRSTPYQVLNLFAYTGALTLKLAANGFHVTHVDSSAPTVAWARRNSQLNQLDDKPVRWIVEDVRKYVARELKRGNRYDAIVLDPPSYGHGPEGRAWRIERDLQDLLAKCVALLVPKQAWLIVTGHSSSVDHRWVESMLSDLLRAQVRIQFEHGRQSLCDLSGRSLDCGWFLRCRIG